MTGGRVPSHGSGVLHDFQRGHDPRRRTGAPSFSRRVKAQVNALAEADAEEQALFDLPTLKRIADDEKIDHAKATAAGILCYVRETGWDTIARQPKMLSTLAWLFDRQLGKPQQSVKIETRTVPPPDVAWRDATDAICDMPTDLLVELRARINRRLDEPRPVANLARGPKATCGETIDEQGRVLLPAPSSLFPKDADDDDG